MTNPQPFLHGSPLTDAIRRALRTGPVKMAVAFWGRGAFERLGRPQGNGSVIACDAFSGACNADALSDLTERGFRIVDVPGLHAKVYIGAREMVVTSANASANGLGEEGDEIDFGLEAGMFVDDPAALQKAITWFDSLTDGKPALTPEEIEQIRLLNRELRSRRPIRSKRASFLQALLDPTVSFDGRRIFVSVYEGVAPPPAVEAAYKATPFYDPARYDASRVYPFFWGAHRWLSVLREGDAILSFESERDAISYEGCWRVQALHADGLIPVADVGLPLGLSLPLPDRKRLVGLVKRSVKSKSLAVDAPLLALDEFAAILRGEVADADV